MNEKKNKRAPDKLMWILKDILRDWTIARNVRISNDSNSVRLTWYGREYEIRISRYEE